MCCHHHRRRNRSGPVSLLFSAIRSQIQAQSIQPGEKLPAYTSTRTLGPSLNAQTTGTIPAAPPSAKSASRWESPDDVLPPPPAYDDSVNHVTRQASNSSSSSSSSSSSTKSREARAMTPDERIAFGQEYMAGFLSARAPVVAGTAQMESARARAGHPEPMSRWEAKLQRKEERYARKVERKAEKYARKAARFAERA